MVKEKSIAVSQKPRFIIELLHPQWGEPSWQAAARYLRRGMKGKNREIYDRVILYKYVVSFGPEPEPWQLEADSSYPVQRLAQRHTITMKLWS